MERISTLVKDEQKQATHQKSTQQEDMFRTGDGNRNATEKSASPSPLLKTLNLEKSGHKMP